MQLLSCRSAAAARHATKVRIAVFCRAKDRFGILVACLADGNPIRHARTATISSDDAIHAAAHAAAGKRELYP